MLAPAVAFSPLPPVAAPENAVTVAVPDCVPAISLTVALPLSVRVSLGSTRPSVVVNDTSVPSGTGVPACSVIVAMRSIEPLSGTEGAVLKS